MSRVAFRTRGKASGRDGLTSRATGMLPPPVVASSRVTEDAGASFEICAQCVRDSLPPMGNERYGTKS